MVIEDRRLLLLFAIAVEELLLWLSRLHRLLSDWLGRHIHLIVLLDDFQAYRILSLWRLIIIAVAEI